MEIAAGTAEEADIGIAAQIGRRAQDVRQIRTPIQKLAREKRNSCARERGKNQIRKIL